MSQSITTKASENKKAHLKTSSSNALLKSDSIDSTTLNSSKTLSTSSSSTAQTVIKKFTSGSATPVSATDLSNSFSSIISNESIKSNNLNTKLTTNVKPVSTVKSLSLLDLSEPIKSSKFESLKKITNENPTLFESQKPKSISASLKNLSVSNTKLVKVDNPPSKIEEDILKSENPIKLNEIDEIKANDIQGIWANKSENLRWKGPIPLENYKISSDPNPQVVKKKPTKKLLYNQEVNVKFLNPPPPPKPGNIIIRQLPSQQIAPAPPLVVRQSKPRIPTPTLTIIREEPPKPPAKIKQKVINVVKIIPPPARKLVIEKLPQIPPKPHSILIERWLPYKKQKRKVILQKQTEPDVVIEDPKNLIVEWESPEVEIKQEIKNLGVFDIDPDEYAKNFGSELLKKHDLPEIAQKIKLPEGLSLACEQITELPELEGDIEFLKKLDLDKIGLSEYKEYFFPNISSNKV